MFKQRNTTCIVVTACSLVLLGMTTPLFAAVDGDFRTLRSDVEQKVQIALSAYEATISALLIENRAMKAELAKLYANPSIKVSMMRQNIPQRTDLLSSSISSSGVITVASGSSGVVIPPAKSTGALTPEVVTPSKPPVVMTGVVTPPLQVSPIATGDALYNSLIVSFLSRQDTIKQSANIDTNLHIEGFEFVGKKGVFLDFHLALPSGPFPAKVLYTISSDGSVAFAQPAGVFVYSADAGKYITKSGSNLFPSLSDRKVFVMPDTKLSNQSQSGSLNLSTKTAEQIDSEIKLYISTYVTGKKDIAQSVWEKVVSLSNEYIALKPTSLEPYRYRYRAYYMMNNSTKALADILKITNSVDATKSENYPFFCNAYKIAQAAGNTDAQIKLRPTVDSIGCK